MAEIFISYARADRARLRPFLDDLDREGLSYFIDERGIRTGEDWSERIVEALRAARIVITFWSEAAVRSPHVRDEARIALNLRTYRGIRLDAVDLPLGFGSYQAADFIGKTPADDPRLWADVVGSGTQPAPSTKTEAPDPVARAADFTGTALKKGLSAQLRALRVAGTIAVILLAYSLSYTLSLAILLMTKTIPLPGPGEEHRFTVIEFALATAIFVGIYPLLRLIVRRLIIRSRD
ncbi:MAG: toll/interleukin-1 receptor domain-containing protein [Alphaproteobacteria bacterium]